MRGYQIVLGPYLGGHCRFVPTCSQYAIDAFMLKPVWKALALITWRIMRCQPLCKGGFDFVKEGAKDQWYRIGG